MELFDHFGTLSGFQINWDKSKLMLVYLNQNISTLNFVPIQISKDRFLPTFTFSHLADTFIQSNLQESDCQKKPEMMRQIGNKKLSILGRTLTGKLSHCHWSGVNKW